AVVIAGANCSEFEDEIANLGLPVFAEPSSGVRHLANSILSYRFKLAEKHQLVSQIDQLVVYGKPTLSRPVIALLRSGVEVIVRPSRMGNFEIPSERKLINEAILSSSDSAWLNSWLEEDVIPETSKELDRASIVRMAWDIGQPEVIVLGASQMIREADHYAPRRNLKVWANRGLAGIDGTIATATGIALHANRVRAILGDLTFLHDVGSLVIDPADGALNLQLILVNDHGGKIFKYLEVAKTVSAEVYDRVFRTGQNFATEDLARAFGWQYVLVSNQEDYASALEMSGRVIIEIVLD
ncbi:MAG: thiamine pyrophosphate-dependent enzyme, partial [Rhodoluna sp.]